MKPDKPQTTNKAAGGASELSAGLGDAPANNLPTWADCALRVENSDFLLKQKAEGGYGYSDSPQATELHRFIYEYDDADPYSSAWFLHRLELVLAEVKLETP